MRRGGGEAGESMNLSLQDTQQMITMMQITCCSKEAQCNLQVIIHATSTFHDNVYCSYAWF